MTVFVLSAWGLSTDTPDRLGWCIPRKWHSQMSLITLLFIESLHNTQRTTWTINRNVLSFNIKGTFLITSQTDHRGMLDKNLDLDTWKLGCYLWNDYGSLKERCLYICISVSVLRHHGIWHGTCYVSISCDICSSSNLQKRIWWKESVEVPEELSL